MSAKLLESLTYSELVSMNACAEALKEFQKLFENKATITQIVKALHDNMRSGWEAWLLAQKPELTLALLAHGADVNVHRNHALGLAAESGRIKVVELLLAHGANVNDPAIFPVSWAAGKGHAKVVKVLLAHGASILNTNTFALPWAAANGHAKVVKILLDHGADKHAVNNLALRRAVANGHTETAKLLNEWPAK